MASPQLPFDGSLGDTPIIIDELVQRGASKTVPLFPCPQQGDYHGVFFFVLSTSAEGVGGRTTNVALRRVSVRNTLGVLTNIDARVGGDDVSVGLQLESGPVYPENIMPVANGQTMYLLLDNTIDGSRLLYVRVRGTLLYVPFPESI